MFYVNVLMMSYRGEHTSLKKKRANNYFDESFVAAHLRLQIN